MGSRPHGMYSTTTNNSDYEHSSHNLFEIMSSIQLHLFNWQNAALCGDWCNLKVKSTKKKLLGLLKKITIPQLKAQTFSSLSFFRGHVSYFKCIFFGFNFSTKFGIKIS